MYSIKCTSKVECTSAKGIIRTTFHGYRQYSPIGGFALPHFFGRSPTWPLRLATYLFRPLPTKSFPTDADNVAGRGAVPVDIEKTPLAGIHDYRSRSRTSFIRNNLRWNWRDIQLASKLTVVHMLLDPFARTRIELADFGLRRGCCGRLDDRHQQDQIAEAKKCERCGRTGNQA
ncbi:MAG: hypothetical protein BGO03_00045 [Mesorhizobium sp. 61-13]|nr:MAG: hypothetical protein BGO03_00045 [Mesorhizobium sp. 61-13]